jgi:hypothetical protein
MWEESERDRDRQGARSRCHGQLQSVPKSATESAPPIWLFFSALVDEKAASSSTFTVLCRGRPKCQKCTLFSMSFTPAQRDTRQGATRAQEPAVPGGHAIWSACSLPALAERPTVVATAGPRGPCRRLTRQPGTRLTGLTGPTSPTTRVASKSPRDRTRRFLTRSRRPPGRAGVPPQPIMDHDQQSTATAERARPGYSGGDLEGVSTDLERT